MWVPKDYLIKLYDLPPKEGLLRDLAGRGVVIRHPRAYEKAFLLEWVGHHFHKAWVGECDVTFSHAPVSTLIATLDGDVMGFVCYEATTRNFVGPIGVLPQYRGQGLGHALALCALHALAEMGYGYAIVGSAVESMAIALRGWFGAIEIEGSNPGVYADPVTWQDEPEAALAK
jgi:GNAT superfamily N-acetyltransferase